MTMRNASIPAKAGTAEVSLRPECIAVLHQQYSGDIATASTAVPGRPSLSCNVAGGNSGRAPFLRGAAGFLRLLPVPMPQDEPEAPAWGERIAAWAQA